MSITSYLVENNKFSQVIPIIYFLRCRWAHDDRVASYIYLNCTSFRVVGQKENNKEESG